MNQTELDQLISPFRDKIGDFEIAADKFISYIIIKPDQLPALMQLLRKDCGFNHLSDLTAVDYGEEFEIIYRLYAIPGKVNVTVKTRVPRSQSELASICSIYPTADWQEREAYDLMGIIFDGHPNLVRVLLPDDFTGHPLRKDYQKGR
ncbi:MAG TPA: NADH-quinone oxidoreductase subunit C [Syntrophomonadaceae bacterium]|nr:NADH-quinone oxidoreductase subunit C [Syntrophomonadaceae bacterium]